LHSQEYCPQFVHDVLDIVESQMLIVLAEDQRRASSIQLKREFQQINSKCTTDEGYCFHGISKDINVQPTTPVKVMLNENAQGMVKQNSSVLSLYEGRTRQSMTIDQLRKMI
jgi:hypothetical protein